MNFSNITANSQPFSGFSGYKMSDFCRTLSRLDTLKELSFILPLTNALCADPEIGCTSSKQQMSAAFGSSISSIDRAIKLAIKLGMIVRTYVTGDRNENHASNYRFTPEFLSLANQFMRDAASQNIEHVFSELKRIKLLIKLLAQHGLKAAFTQTKIAKTATAKVTTPPLHTEPTPSLLAEPPLKNLKELKNLKSKKAVSHNLVVQKEITAPIETTSTLDEANGRIKLSCLRNIIAAARAKTSNAKRALRLKAKKDSEMAITQEARKLASSMTNFEAMNYRKAQKSPKDNSTFGDLSGMTYNTVPDGWRTA